MVRRGCGPRKKMAVVAVAGLGCFAIMFGRAMSVERTAISDSPKEAETKKVPCFRPSERLWVDQFIP